MFARHQHRAAPLAADRDALRDTQQHQQDRCPGAGARIGRQEADADRADAHDRERRHQRLLAADAVAEMPEHQAAERSREKADREGAERGQRGEKRVAAGKKQLAEDQRGRGGVDIKVVPLDGGADERGGGRTFRLPGCGVVVWLAMHVGVSKIVFAVRMARLLRAVAGKVTG
jgi:hypothetical protein